MRWFPGRKRFYFLLSLYFLFLTPLVDSSAQGELVGFWANRLGKELNDLAVLITKSSEIKKRYSFLNAQVERKDPKSLLAEVVENISRMMDRKMDAIKCIMQKAEEAAERFEFNMTSRNYTYYSSKYSPIEGQEKDELPDSLKDNEYMYTTMVLNNDTHFYNALVNTSYSSVHVPTNVYDRHEEPETFIKWSEVLDDVFRQNYNSDPSLYWQYFGSSTGVMRHYPAMRWVKHFSNDLFDCRVRTWFIEAATCTKDVVILVDNSGSMAGVRKHIATVTVYKILETLSNNDYVNIMNYSKTADFLVPCFTDILAPATQENIIVFKETMKTLDPCNKADLNLALDKSFSLLAKVRKSRNCEEDSKNCNQAIILITDGITGNMTDTVIKHNYLFNGTVIPVRIFVYLIGSEVTNAEHAVWMACNNRGYYDQIETLEQVSESVYEYIPVVARPLVLQAKEHPPSWTHAYADITFSEENRRSIFEKYRLLTSVAIPAFDTKVNQQNDSRTAKLLGVAATDVPINDIEKLTLPYKIGVNAYAFLVSNNGYVLMHPDLRPIYGSNLTDNYNSIDLTEVEQLDNGFGAREIDPVLKKLRDFLVAGMEGAMHDVQVKYHYDDMRRVSREIFDYYFAPIPGTPFSIAIAIPDLYGNFSLEVGDEIQKNRHTGIKITSFFEGSNWKIHPNWVYCKYHYLEGHEFETPEMELLDFLGRMYDRDFKWERQYEATKIKKHPEFKHIQVADLKETECGRKTFENDDYYCDRQLVQRLVFDAKNTMFAFAEPWKFTNDREESLFKRYNATLRFVATMSGLTRWEYIFGEEENNTIKEFGDLHSQAIDETWYKAAVLQHRYDPESFVYSVPFEKYNKDTLVTGSYAIFPKDAGMEAPGAVVGFQFSHSQLHKQFFDLTADKKSCRDCLACGPNLKCYVIDSSGYIVIARNKQLTGKFFGEVEGAVFESMLQEGIFEKVIVYDFQAICTITESVISSGETFFTPVDHLLKLIKWFIAKLVCIMVETNLSSFWKSYGVFGYTCEYYESSTTPTTTTTTSTTTPKPLTKRLRKGEVPEEEEYFRYASEPKNVTRSRPCDLQRSLYILQQSVFIEGNGYSGEVPHNCSSSFYLKLIPSSNLLLVAVKCAPPRCTRSYTVEPREVYYNVTDFPCHKLYLNNLSRKRLSGCFNEHPLVAVSGNRSTMGSSAFYRRCTLINATKKEHEIKICGRSSKLQSSNILVSVLIVMQIMYLLKSVIYYL